MGFPPQYHTILIKKWILSLILVLNLSLSLVLGLCCLTPLLSGHIFPGGEMAGGHLSPGEYVAREQVCVPDPHISAQRSPGRDVWDHISLEVPGN